MSHHQACDHSQAAKSSTALPICSLVKVVSPKLASFHQRLKHASNSAGQDRRSDRDAHTASRFGIPTRPHCARRHHSASCSIPGAMPGSRSQHNAQTAPGDHRRHHHVTIGPRSSLAHHHLHNQSHRQQLQGDFSHHPLCCKPNPSQK